MAPHTGACTPGARQAASQASPLCRPGLGPEPARYQRTSGTAWVQGPRGQSCSLSHPLQFPSPRADPELQIPTPNAH